jgi:hypothetical protein
MLPPASQVARAALCFHLLRRLRLGYMLILASQDEIRGDKRFDRGMPGA